MASTVFPAASAASKTPTRVTITSGTSYTVPAGVTSIIATLIGGGGGAGAGSSSTADRGVSGPPGQIIATTITTTPGNSIAYAIGAGGAGASSPSSNGTGGGTTTFTGATSAVGGNSGPGAGGGTTGTAGLASNNGGVVGARDNSGGAGGAGQIILEYWT